MWWLIVAFKRKGLEDTLKTTRVNQRVINSGDSMLGSATHRKCSEGFLESHLLEMETQKNVKDRLARLRSNVQTIVEGGSGGSCGSIIYRYFPNTSCS